MNLPPAPTTDHHPVTPPLVQGESDHTNRAVTGQLRELYPGGMPTFCATLVVSSCEYEHSVATLPGSEAAQACSASSCDTLFSQ